MLTNVDHAKKLIQNFQILVFCTNQLSDPDRQNNSDPKHLIVCIILLIFGFLGIWTRGIN